MDTSEAMNGDEGLVREHPAEVYARRLRELSRLESADQRREKLLAFAKLIVVAIALIGAVLFLHFLKALVFLAMPIAVFLVLAVVPDNLIRRIRRRARAIAFY